MMGITDKYSKNYTSETTVEKEDKDLRETLVSNVDTGFQQCVEKYKNLLYSLAFSALRDEYIAEDVVQESWIRAYKALRNFDHSQLLMLQIRAWLCTIVKNVAIDYLAKERKQSSIRLDSLVEKENWIYGNPEEMVLSEEALSELNELIEMLPLCYRLDVLMRFCCELSYQEITVVLNQPLGTAKVYVSRGIASLQKMIQNNILVGECLHNIRHSHWHSGTHRKEWFSDEVQQALFQEGSLNPLIKVLLLPDNGENA